MMSGGAGPARSAPFFRDAKTDAICGRSSSLALVSAIVLRCRAQKHVYAWRRPLHLAQRAQPLCQDAFALTSNCTDVAAIASKVLRTVLRSQLAACKTLASGKMAGKEGVPVLRSSTLCLRVLHASSCKPRFWERSLLKRVSTIVAALSAWRQILLHVATRLYLCYSRLARL